MSKHELYTCPYLNMDDENEPIGDSTGEPYVVSGRDEQWIPLNVIVFAQSEEHAKEIITKAIVDSKELALKQIKENKYPIDKITYKNKVRRADKLLNLELLSEPFDKRYLSKAIWACNERIV